MPFQPSYASSSIFQPSSKQGRLDTGWRRRRERRREEEEMFLGLSQCPAQWLHTRHCRKHLVSDLQVSRSGKSSSYHGECTLAILLALLGITVWGAHSGSCSCLEQAPVIPLSRLFFITEVCVGKVRVVAMGARRSSHL